MTYYNIIVSYGEKLSFKECEKRCLRRDYSGFALRINSKLKHKISKFDVKVISLISMTANDDRIKEIVKHAEGFIYTVTMNATTAKWNVSSSIKR